MFPDVTDFFDVARDYVDAYLLTDTCQIYPITYTNDGSGSSVVARGSARQYNNSTNIPCRLDQTRQFRETNLFLQETTPTNYYMSLPYDVTIEVNDEIVHNGITYQIRELYDDSTWKAVKKAFVVSVR